MHSYPDKFVLAFPLINGTYWRHYTVLAVDVSNRMIRMDKSCAGISYHNPFDLMCYYSSWFCKETNIGHSYETKAKMWELRASNVKSKDRLFITDGKTRTEYYKFSAGTPIRFDPVHVCFLSGKDIDRNFYKEEESLIDELRHKVVNLMEKHSNIYIYDYANLTFNEGDGWNAICNELYKLYDAMKISQIVFRLSTPVKSIREGMSLNPHTHYKVVENDYRLLDKLRDRLFPQKNEPLEVSSIIKSIYRYMERVTLPDIQTSRLLKMITGMSGIKTRLSKP